MAFGGWHGKRPECALGPQRLLAVNLGRFDLEICVQMRKGLGDCLIVDNGNVREGTEVEGTIAGSRTKWRRLRGGASKWMQPINNDWW